MSWSGLSIEVRSQLRQFELDVSVRTESETLGVFGPSGSGKTTLLECLAGWNRAARGQVRVGDRVLLDTDRGVSLPPQERRIGYVPQEGLLFPHWTVRQNILASRLAEDATLYRRVVQLLELELLEARSPAALSGGERGRVALARALCSKPDLLLLDEPLAALDRPLRRRILFDLARVREAFGTPLLIVSHDPTEVQALCEHVVVLERGQKVSEGAPSELFTGGLLAATDFENVLRGTVVELGEGTAEVQLATDVRITIPIRSHAAELGAPCVVGLRADDVLISTGPLSGISARNCVPAKVLEIQESAGDVHLLAGLGAQGTVPLSVSLTIASRRELGLVPGREIYLVFKTQSCQLLAATRGT